MSKRKTNSEILDEIDRCENPVTLCSLKSVAVTRLREAEQVNKRLLLLLSMEGRRERRLLTAVRKIRSVVGV